MTAHFMDSHMNFRMSSRDKKTVETAARLKGLKPNTYARQKLLENAERDISEAYQFNTLVLSDSDWERFLAVMEAPIQENENLKRAVNSYKSIHRAS